MSPSPTSPTGEGASPVERPTLAAYLDAWVERRRTQVRPHTHAGYTTVVRCYLAPHLGHLRLDRLDRRTIERAYATLLVRGGVGGRALAPASVRNAAYVLRRALEDAVLAGVLEANPATLARTPRHDPSADELHDDLPVWTGAQAAAFLIFVDDDPWRALWHLAVGTGARRGELLGLRWTDVDLPAGQVRIRRSLSVVDATARLLRTKSSRPRVLCIAPSVVEAVARHRDEQERRRARASRWDDRWGLVFTDDAGRYLYPNWVSRRFRRLADAAPVPRIRLHDVRHTHASLLLALGVPVQVVSERLGHGRISMTLDTYGHLLPGQDADAAGRFEQLLWRDRPD